MILILISTLTGQKVMLQKLPMLSVERVKTLSIGVPFVPIKTLHLQRQSRTGEMTLEKVGLQIGNFVKFTPLSHRIGSSLANLWQNLLPLLNPSLPTAKTGLLVPVVYACSVLELVWAPIAGIVPAKIPPKAMTVRWIHF